MYGRAMMAEMWAERLLEKQRKHNPAERERVETALRRYRQVPHDIVAGVDITRYARKRLLAVRWWAAPFWTQAILDHYPVTPMYVILRMARAGHLKYRPSVDEKNHKDQVIS